MPGIDEPSGTAVADNLYGTNMAGSTDLWRPDAANVIFAQPGAATVTIPVNGEVRNFTSDETVASLGSVANGNLVVTLHRHTETKIEFETDDGVIHGTIKNADAQGFTNQPVADQY